MRGMLATRVAFSHCYPPLIYYLTERSLFKKCPPTGKSLKKALEERASEKDVLDDETYAKVSMGVNNNSDTSEKVLGMIWDCNSDKFIFCLAKLAEKAKSVVATKRNILSILAGLFDPLGIISPVAVSIKMLFQELCLDRVEWDEEFEGERKKRWLSWVEDLERVSQIVVSRCIYGSLIGKTT